MFDLDQPLPEIPGNLHAPLQAVCLLAAAALATAFIGWFLAPPIGPFVLTRHCYQAAIGLLQPALGFMWFAMALELLHNPAIPIVSWMTIGELLANTLLFLLTLQLPVNRTRAGKQRVVFGAVWLSSLSFAKPGLLTGILLWGPLLGLLVSVFYRQLRHRKIIVAQA